MTEPMKDFSRPRKKIAFTIDGDVFEGAPVMPAETLMQFGSKLAVGETSEENFRTMGRLLEMVLLPDSYKRIMERLSSRENPIDIEQLSDLVPWLLEQYGLRPTRPSSSSADGPPSPESGTTSTETTSAAGSISSISPLNVF